MVVIAVIAGIVCCAGPVFVGIIAAIAIPSLLRARMGANEGAAIARLRTMTSAQAAWASLHEGRFTEPACLADPRSCGETSGTAYVAPDAGLLETRSGYRFGFVLRPPPDDGSEPGGFAYWAAPSTPGSTGRRRFCVEETGVVWEYDAVEAPWSEPSSEEPRCPGDGRPVG